MSRPLRLELAGGLYHITSRGDRREDIYIDDSDRNKWLELLGQVCQRYNWRCHAYCLMTNHYHVVVETVSLMMCDKSGGITRLIALPPSLAMATRST